MENRLPKRLATWLLTLVMLLSLVPAMGVTASAEDDTFYEQVSIRRYRAFWDYLRSPDSRELVLDTDINYTLSGEDEEIEVRRSQRLDLNGHKIRIDATKRASFFSLITIYDGELTLYDSKGGGEIAVEFAMDSKEHSIIKMFPNSGAYPKFTMNSGTLTRLNPITTNAQGSNGCVSDSINSRVKDGEPRPQITINGGTINCPYSWDRSKPLPIYLSQFMPTALLLRESKLTVNGGTFNGMVWIEDLTQKKGETEPRVFLNGGVFNSSFVVQDVPKDVTRIIIDGARFNDGLYVGDSSSERTYNVGSKPALLIKSGVFDSPDQKPKLDIYAAIGENTENAMKCFPNSAIKMNGNIYTSENLGLLAKNGRYNYFNSNTPIEVIGRAWDLKEVLLDGSPIAVPNIRDGAAFRKAGSVPVYTVSTLGTHELVYRWYDLAKELRDAGWYYEIRCERGPGLVNIYNGSYTTANGICEWRYRLPNTPANIDAGQMAFTINLKHATEPTSIVYSNQYLLRYQVVQDSAQVITAGRLNMSGGDIIPSDAVSANQVTRGARENRFTVSAQTNWSLSGDTRSKTVTLKAANGYRFLSASDFSVEGANCVTAKSSSVSADGKTCVVRVEARVCRLLTHIAGELENFYDDRTFADVSVTSYDPDKCRFEIYTAVERSFGEVSPDTKIDGRSWYYFFLNIYPEPGYAVRSNSKVAVVNYGGYWSNGSAVEEEVYTAIYGDWYCEDSGQYYGEYWCLGRNKENTEFVGIDPRYERTTRTLNLTIKEPVAGENPNTDPSYKKIDGLPADVTVDKFEWDMDKDTVFQAGKEYMLLLYLTVPKENPSGVWAEDSDHKYITVYINGVNCNKYNAWQGTDTGRVNCEWGIAEHWLTPISEAGAGVAVSGKITSYNPNNPTTVKLLQNGTEKYSTTIKAATGSGQKEQTFSFPAVAAGTYDLVVTKSAHLKYTVKNITVGSTPLDLTKHSKAAIRTITLLCGDIVKNGYIDFADYQELLSPANYGKKTTDTGVNALADLNGNGYIDFADYQILLSSQHYGKSAVSVNFGG